MWSELGLDLKTHAALLEALGAGYQQVFLSQKNRPEGMQYFDFVMSEVHGLRIKELLDSKAKGHIVVGSFCVFVPEELILAVDGISVGLCTGAEFGFDLAEKYLPRNTCALIKSAFGFKLSKVCPYLESSDIIVGENTCDGKKKSYEEFAKIVDKLYVIDLPQTKSENGKALLKAEYQKFITVLEEKSGKKITVESLKKGIEIVNNKRKAVHRLANLRSHVPALISGLDALLINQVYFYDDPVRFTASVNKICDELEESIARKEGVSPAKHPRIIVSGCPMAVPNWKLPSIIEQSGAVIVGEESCVGERGIRNETSSDGENLETLIENVVDRYFQIDCAIFTPNPERKEHIQEMFRKYNADGVIHYALQFCQPYDIESHSIEEELEAEGIPVLNLVTDYSNEDVGQLSTRVEAFIERITE
jgi:benzoyl-CoA reductase/2-hydroxyglutaryl-CoA dehydratase subunit BcrC/BadD/HgdB